MREHKKLAKENYNTKAENYEKTFDGKFTEAFKSLLVKEIKVHKNDRLLDVACGTGGLLYKLSQLYNIQAYGIDISDNMIKVAKERHPAINFQIGDSEALKFSNGFFNIVTVCAAFHHFPNPNEFIREAARTLVNGGSIYIAEVYIPPIIRQVYNIFLPFSSAGDVKLYSPKEIMRMLQNAGLSNFKVTKKGHIQIISAEKL